VCEAQDVAKKMNADNHDSTTDYTYDPVDRLAKSVKTGNGARTSRPERASTDAS
jgi:hypothetical protein